MTDGDLRARSDDQENRRDLSLAPEQESTLEKSKPKKRGGGRKPIFTSAQERKQRNRDAQAAFRERRTEYIKELEGTVGSYQRDLLDVQAAHGNIADECVMLRYKNSLLERILLEKGVDVRAELYQKTDPSLRSMSPLQTKVSAGSVRVAKHSVRKAHAVRRSISNATPPSSNTPPSSTSSPSNPSSRDPILGASLGIPVETHQSIMSGLNLLAPSQVAIDHLGKLSHLFSYSLSELSGPRLIS